MLLLDDWSRIIEGSHALFCGIFALTAIILKMKNKHYKFYIAVAVSMGTQLMNSILYMANYFNQLYCIPNVSSKDSFNININCNSNTPLPIIKNIIFNISFNDIRVIQQ